MVQILHQIWCYFDAVGHMPPLKLEIVCFCHCRRKLFSSLLLVLIFTFKLSQTTYTWILCKLHLNMMQTTPECDAWIWCKIHLNMMQTTPEYDANYTWMWCKIHLNMMQTTPEYDANYTLIWCKKTSFYRNCAHFLFCFIVKQS